jgi:hypothetical protein
MENNIVDEDIRNHFDEMGTFCKKFGYDKLKINLKLFFKPGKLKKVYLAVKEIVLEIWYAFDFLITGSFEQSHYMLTNLFGKFWGKLVYSCYRLIFFQLANEYLIPFLIRKISLKKYRLFMRYYAWVI